MIILEIVLRVPGIGFFCWLLFTLTVYALPYFAGLTAGFAAYHTGAGGLGAVIVAVLAGGSTLAIGQIAFGAVQGPLVRAAIGLFFAIPAAIAGYPRPLGWRISGYPPRAGGRSSRSFAVSWSAALRGAA